MLIPSVKEDNTMDLNKILSVPVKDLKKHSKVGVEILPDKSSVFSHFARSIADEIATNNKNGRPTRLILPVGPVEQYPILADITNREKISWKNVHTFNMDEYLDWQGRPVPLDSPFSFEGYMRNNLFNKISGDLRIPEKNIHFPSPFRIDELSEAISAAGGVDTCYGSIGYHGHIAFNEPYYSRWSEISNEEYRNSLTRVIALASDTIVINSIRGGGGNSAIIPPMAVTIGMKDILSSKRIRLYCFDSVFQRTIFRIALMGEVSVQYPVTFVQENKDCIIYSDRETAEPPVLTP
jgi:glucosamine-6-phosphate deaminase